MTTLFISYRRSDTEGQAGRVADHFRNLPARPTVYFDTRDNRPGDDWLQRINENLQQCDVMLVIIGAGWMNPEAAGQPPRLHLPGDIVAHEISTALTRGIRVVPVLVDGAKLPAATALPAGLQGSAAQGSAAQGNTPRRAGLLDKQAAELRSAAFDRDIAEIVTAVLGAQASSWPAMPSTPSSTATMSPAPAIPRWWPVAAALGLAGAGLLAWQPWGPRPSPPATPAAAAAPAAVPVAPPLQHINVDLRVDLADAADSGLQTVDEVYLYPKLPVETNYLTLLRTPGSQPAEYKLINATMPPAGQRYQGGLYRKPLSGREVAGGARNEITQVCFQPVAGAQAAEPRARLRCQERDHRCRPDNDDLKLVQACADTLGTAGAAAWLPLGSAHAAAAPVVVAANAAGAAAGRDWVVPTLDTLLASLEGPAGHAKAFSEVHLQTQALTAPELANADEVALALTINQSRVWVGGMPPNAQALSFKPGQPLALAFGLENLNAAGANAGIEDLQVELLFLRQKQTVHRQVLKLPFIALRDIPAPTVVPGAPWGLTWQIGYHPTPADAYQIILSSGGPDQAAAVEADKRRFDAAHAQGDAPLVGVIRPPIPGKNPNFALAAGLRQPSGQIRYSFDADSARALCQRLDVLHLRPEPHRRHISNGRDYLPCSTVGKPA